MRIKNKNFFTLPEVTMAIAILGIGLISILGVFPVSIKSGLQAVKLSESIHKARSAARLWQTFPLKVAGADPLPIKADVYAFAFKDATDNLSGVSGTPFVVTAKTPIAGMLNGKYELERVSMTVGTDFVTSFYVIK